MNGTNYKENGIMRIYEKVHVNNWQIRLMNNKMNKFIQNIFDKIEGKRINIKAK